MRTDADFHADYLITNHQQHIGFGRVVPAFAPAVRHVKVFNNIVASVLALDLSLVDEATVAPYRRLYASLDAETPIASARFNVFLRDRTLFLTKDGCHPFDTKSHFIMDVVPRHSRDMPDRRRVHGFIDMEFPFDWTGVRVDGNCLVAMPLPDYELARITIGQAVPMLDWTRHRRRCSIWLKTVVFNDMQEPSACATEDFCGIEPRMPRCELEPTAGGRRGEP